MKKAKRRSRPGGGGSDKTNVHAGGQVDHTLRTLLVNYLALPPGHTVVVDGRMYLSGDALLYLRAIEAREKLLGGAAAVEAALNSLVPGRAA